MGYRIDFSVGGGVLPGQVLMAARRLGCDLRRFEDHHAALAWLRSAQLSNP